MPGLADEQEQAAAAGEGIFERRRGARRAQRSRPTNAPARPRRRVGSAADGEVERARPAGGSPAGARAARGPARCPAPRRARAAPSGRPRAPRPGGRSDRARASAARAGAHAAGARRPAPRARRPARRAARARGRPRCAPRARRAALLEPGDLGLRERLEREVGERRAAPQRERLRSSSAALLQRRRDRARYRPPAQQLTRTDRRRRLTGVHDAASSPEPSVTSNPSPRGPRLSCETWFWITFGAVTGGRLLTPELLDDPIRRDGLVRIDISGGRGGLAACHPQALTA